jgi:hypothetical protein
MNHRGIEKGANSFTARVAAMFLLSLFFSPI